MIIHLGYSYDEVNITSQSIIKEMLFASRGIKVLSVSTKFGYDVSWDEKCSEIHWTVVPFKHPEVL